MNKNFYTNLLLGIGFLGITTACNLQATLLEEKTSENASISGTVQTAEIKTPKGSLIRDFDGGQKFFLDLNTLHADGVTCSDSLSIDSISVKTSKGVAVSESFLNKVLDGNGKPSSLEVDFGSIAVGTFVVSVTVKSSAGAQKIVQYKVYQNSKTVTSWKVTNVYSMGKMEFPYLTLSDAQAAGMADLSIEFMDIDSIFDASGKKMDPKSDCMGMTNGKFGYIDFICRTEVVRGTVLFFAGNAITTVSFVVDSIPGSGGGGVTRTYDASNWVDTNTSEVKITIDNMSTDGFIGPKEDFAYLADLQWDDGDANCVATSSKGMILGYTCTWVKAKPTSGTVTLIDSSGRSGTTIGIEIK